MQCASQIRTRQPASTIKDKDIKERKQKDDKIDQNSSFCQRKVDFIDFYIQKCGWNEISEQKQKELVSVE